MNRRTLLQAFSVAIALPPLPQIFAILPAPALAGFRSRSRPGDSAWPSDASWERLHNAVDGRLVRVRPALEGCKEAPASPACAEFFKQLKNPYFLGDEIGLTQSLG